MNLVDLLMRGRNGQRGFTIVELLVVIVVIGILATLAIVGFNGVQSRAEATALQSELSSASRKIEAAKVTHASERYPASTEDAELTPGTGITYTYSVDNSTTPPTYCLSATNNKGLSYFVTHNTSPAVGSCTPPNCASSGQVGVYPDCYSEFSPSPATGQTNFAAGYGYTGIQPTRCPTGFVPVPGNTLFNKPNGFCVMKYEAKQASSTVPESTQTGLPWTNIPWDTAKIYSANVAGCSGCHLISEEEWLTIAHNVLWQSSNWSGGSFGSGYIFSGHNDGTPNNTLAAAADNSGYSGTGQSTGNQRRTLTLSNGEVIWDMAGNAYEWTSGDGSTQIGTSSTANWRQWNTITNGNAVTPNPTPVYGTPSASAFTSTQGIGALYASNLTSVYGSYMRGGRWTNTSNAGIFTLVQANGTSQGDPNVGFRAAR